MNDTLVSSWVGGWGSQVRINVIIWLDVCNLYSNYNAVGVAFLLWKRVNAALKYDYVSGHGLSVHPGWTVLLGRGAASVQNGRIHLSSEGDVTNR